MKRQLNKEEKERVKTALETLKIEIAYNKYAVDRVKFDLDNADIVFNKQISELKSKFAENEHNLKMSTEYQKILELQLKEGVEIKESKEDNA